MYNIPGKNFKNDGNQKLQLLFRRIFPLILVWAILRLFLTLCVVFGRFTSLFATWHRF